MAMSRVGSADTWDGSTPGTGTFTLSFTNVSPTDGNLLVAALITKSTGDTSTAIPSGWTEVWHNSTNGGAQSLIVAKISDGAEIDIDFSDQSNLGTYAAVVAEYTGNDSSAVTNLLSANDVTNILTDATSTGTGTVTPTSADGVCVAFAFCQDTREWAGTETWTNSLSSVAVFEEVSNNPHGEMAELFNTGTTGISSTYSTTDTGDPCHGVIVWFPESSGSSGITGTIGVTEGADTASASGTVQSNITGTVAVTEAADTAAASGTIQSNITGTIGVTEAADIAAAAGSVTTFISGTISLTEIADIAAASGTVTAGGEKTGTIGVTEAADTASASGTVQSNITGTIAVTEQPDIAAATDGLGPDYFPFSTVGFYVASIIAARLEETDMINATDSLGDSSTTQDKHIN